jgi:CHAD domain-containing protein
LSAEVSDDLRKLTAKVRDNAARVVREGPTERDAEAIHDYRVALRRLRTMLRPLRSSYGKERVRAIEAELKRFAERTGELREEEVLSETLEALPLSAVPRRSVHRWLESRGRRLDGRRRAVAKELRDRRTPQVDSPDQSPLTGGYLEVVLTDLDHLLEAGPKKQRTSPEIARRALGRALAEVRAFAADLDPTEIEDMHLLRIRFKRLRYTAELLGPSLDLPAEVQKSAAHMQKVLGNLHDLDDAIGTLTRTRSLDTRSRQSVRAALERARVAVARKASKDLARKLAVIDAAFAAIED